MPCPLSVHSMLCRVVSCQVLGSAFDTVGCALDGRGRDMDRGSLPIRRVGTRPRRVGVVGPVVGPVVEPVAVFFARLCER